MRCMRQDFAVAHVSGDDDAAWVELCHLNQPVRLLQGASADNHPLSAVVQIALNGFPVAYSSANLHFAVGRTQNSFDFGCVGAASRDSIEVNDVQMPKPVLPPGYRDTDRVGNADDFLIIGTSGELNARSAAEIESWNCDHPGRCRIRARIMTAKVRR